MKIEREKFLNILRGGDSGLTGGESIEQSDSFIFEDGQYVTFDGEVLSRTKFNMGFDASVPASDFRKILLRMPEDEISIQLKKGELIVAGKSKRAGISVNTKILSPYKEVPKPKKMRSVPITLMHRLIQAARICNKDHSNPRTTHVHATPDKVEATDTIRLLRSVGKTGLKKEMMVPASALLQTGESKIKKAEMVDGWFHALLENKTLHSYRCAKIEYFEEEQLDSILEVEGEKLVLPKNLIKALDRASVMEARTAGEGEGEVQVYLKKGVLRIKTQKEEGWYEEKKKIEYAGRELQFYINPNLLKELLAKSREVVVSEQKMKYEKDNVHFVAYLQQL